MQSVEALCLAAGMMLFIPLAVAQEAPRSAGAPWHPPAENKASEELSNIPENTSFFDSSKTYSLAELINIAEQHNPDTRVAWERAKQQANAVGDSEKPAVPIANSLGSAA